MSENIFNFVYFGSIYAPNGASTFARNIVENKLYFQKKNWELNQFYLKILNPKHIIKNDSLLYGKNAIKKRIKAIIGTLAKYSLFFSILYLYFAYLRNAIKVVNQISGGQANTFLFNDIFTFYFFYCKNGSFHNSKSILILHNNGEPLKMLFELLPGLKNYHFDRYLIKKFRNKLKNVNKIILLSEISKNVFLKYHPEYQNKSTCAVIPNGIALNEYKEIKTNEEHEKDIKGIAVGTINYRKGYDILLKSIAKLKNKNKIKINCIGGIDNPAILSLANDLDVTNVIFIGPQNEQQIENYFNNSDFFILCSRDEGLPISIIEAMRAKLPIFATNVGGIPELITNGENGILMKPNIDDISKTLQGITEQKYDLKKMGKSAYDLFNKKFTIERMLDNYIEILNELK